VSWYQLGLIPAAGKDLQREWGIRVAFVRGPKYYCITSIFSLRRGQMQSLVETNVEPRKEWVAPELKKIDVEAITAASFAGRDDSAGLS
jgi:hypothetical protein